MMHPTMRSWRVSRRRWSVAVGGKSMFGSLLSSGVGGTVVVILSVSSVVAVMAGLRWGGDFLNEGHGALEGGEQNVESAS